jgi:hypothetical protein
MYLTMRVKVGGMHPLAGPDGGRATFDGRHGSMKPEGRRAIMALSARHKGERTF